jgi:iron(III) transport system ATP-binding protein
VTLRQSGTMDPFGPIRADEADTVLRMIGLELRELVLPGVADPLNVTVDLDEVVAVVLPEPAATALADAVTGITPSDEGEIWVNGAPIESPSPGVPSTVALVPADGGLLPHLTVRANIAYGRCVGEGQKLDRLGGQLRAAATRLNLLDVLNSHPYELTAGRRLKVGLARALLRDPVAILLEDRVDHPSWAAQLTRRDPLHGAAVLIVADRLDRVEGLADHVVEAG